MICFKNEYYNKFFATEFLKRFYLKHVNLEYFERSRSRDQKV